MRLTLQTDYALRMLIFLSVRRDRSSTVGDIAARYAISRHHLLKVGLKLAREGYVATARGRAGGIVLAREPGQINLGEVVRAFESDFGLVECMQSEGGLCVLSPACRLKGVLAEALNAFLAVLDAYTLSDIVDNRAAIADLLGLSTRDQQIA